mgnify:FL=1
MRYNNINNINKEAPITYKIRINQPLFMFIIIVIIRSEAIVKPQYPLMNGLPLMSSYSSYYNELI